MKKTIGMMLSAAAMVACSDAAAPVPPDAATDPDALAELDAGPDVDNGAPSDVYPAPHPAYAQMTSLGGPVLAHPRVQPVFFSRDPHIATMTDFLSQLGASNVWTQSTSEYGVGPETMAQPIIVTDPPPAATTSNDIASWITSNISGTSPAWGAADTNTVYMLFYPSTTNVTLIYGSTSMASCTGFHGFHDQTTSPAGAVAYAVIAECPTDTQDFLTGVTSHESYEAATDPFPEVEPAWMLPDDDHLAWALVAGSEVSDMCFMGGMAKVGPYTTFSSWSNASLAAGGPPCVPPIGSEPYFNSAPVLGDDITIDLNGYPLKNKGLKAAVGESKTIELDLFSSAKTSGPWTVEADDTATLLTGAPSRFDFAFDRTSGVNGEKLHLTVTPKAALAGGGGFFAIVSVLGAERSFWYAYVQN
jgi:hypothetical protein